MTALRIAVTGATGFLGSHITLALVRGGAQVTGVVRTPSKGAWLEAHGVTFRKADLQDPSALEAAFDGMDAVVSNAALGSKQGDMAQMEAVNCEGIRNVFRAASAAGVRRLIHISTTGVYRNRLFVRMDENTPGFDTERRRYGITDLTTDWRYCRTKTLAEGIAWAQARSLDLDLTVLRPGPIYGARDGKATARLRASLDRAIALAPTVGIPWVCASDVAVAVQGALDNPASVGRPYNITGEPVSQYQFLKTMKRHSGARALLIPLPVPTYVCYDTTAAQRDLGFAPRSIDQGLRETFA